MPISRRTFISSGAAFALLPACRKNAPVPLYSYTAQALGIDVDFQFDAPSQIEADILFENVMDEIARLNAMFSLYDRNSEISRLNGYGRLRNASDEFIDLITQAKEFQAASFGAFDITVQPLWLLYQATPTPPPTLFDSAMSRIGSEYIRIKDRDIIFEKPGMAITVNGCAQGYISHAIVTLLREHGVKHGLVNIGEYEALGPKPGGKPWVIGIQDPDNATEIIETVELMDQGLATSGGYGGLFTDDGTATHIFDPRTGVSPSRYKSVSVVADNAFLADAMSTAFLSLTADKLMAVKAEYPAISKILIVDLKGKVTAL